MTRSRLVLVVVIVVLAIVLSTAVRSDRGAQSWQEMQRHLLDVGVKGVELTSPGRGESVLSEAETREFVEAFLAGSFSEDNSGKYGPTPIAVVLYTLEDGEVVPVSQWPDGRFHASQDGRQFLIVAPELATLLQERGFAGD